MGKYYTDMADTSLSAYAAIMNGKRETYKKEMLKVFNDNPNKAFSIWSLHLQTGISEKTIPSIMLELRRKWLIVFSHREVNSGSKQDANYFKFNPTELPTLNAIDFEIDYWEKKRNRANEKIDVYDRRINTLYETKRAHLA